MKCPSRARWQIVSCSWSRAASWKSRRPRRFSRTRHGPRPGLHPYRHARTRRHVRLSLPHEPRPCPTIHARSGPGPGPKPKSAPKPISAAPAARHGAGADGIADPAAGERGDAPRRRAALLVRRIRQPDRGRHPRSRQPVAGAGRNPLRREPGRFYLRHALSRYLSALHGVDIGTERIAVSGSGAGHHAGRAAAARAGRPRRRHHPTLAQPDRDSRILGARTQRYPLSVTDGRWTLDVPGLLQALRPGTRLLLLNSPNNPTGWTIAADDIAPILRHCRQHGIWILCDDVYERLLYDPGRPRRRPSSGTARPMTASSRSTVSPRPGP